MEKVQQHAGGQHIARSQVHAQAGQIPGSPNGICIRAIGKLLDDVAVVLALVGEIEPNFVFDDGTGKIDARGPVVELDALYVLHCGDEIGGVDAKVIVSVLDLEIGEPAGSFAELGGIPAAANVNFPQRVRVEADCQRAAGGLAHLESVKIILHLLRAGAGHMDLSAAVGDHSGNVREDIAIIARGGIRNIGDVAGGNGLRTGALLGINRRRLCRHFDLLPVFADRLETNFQLRGLTRHDIHAGHQGRVETPFFNKYFVGSQRKLPKDGNPRRNRTFLGNGFAVLLNDDDGQGQRFAVLVHHGNVQLAGRNRLGLLPGSRKRSFFITPGRCGAKEKHDKENGPGLRKHRSG